MGKHDFREGVQSSGLHGSGSHQGSMPQEVVGQRVQLGWSGASWGFGGGGAELRSGVEQG